MSSGRGARTPFWKVAVAASSIGLAACQSGDVSEVLDPGAAEAAQTAVPSKPGVPQKPITVGKGSTNIAMLLPLSAPGTIGEEGRKMRDGAKLAMADIGNDLITLRIEDTRGDAALARKMAVDAMGSSARAVIGPTELAAAQHIAKISGDKRPPVLALAENFVGSPGVYSVSLSEADSAAAAASALAERGKRKFVLFVAEGSDADAISKRVANSLSIYGATLAITLPYRTGSGAEKAVSDMLALIDKPDAVIVASGAGNPAAIVASLRARGVLGAGVALVGTSRWLAYPLSDPLLDGAYIATLDIAETGPIAARFKSTFGYDPDVNVAYAYDMVALTAGIASAVGPKGLTRQVLENKKGFRGSTGLFRFRSDGASERSMPFYQIGGGQLRQIQKSISGF